MVGRSPEEPGRKEKVLLLPEIRATGKQPRGRLDERDVGPEHRNLFEAHVRAAGRHALLRDAA